MYQQFMDYFGINTPDDLPKIREVLAEQEVKPSLISEMDFKSFTGDAENEEEIKDELPDTEPHSNLTINENGEITDIEEEGDRSQETE